MSSLLSLHIGARTVGLVSGIVAVSLCKGERLRRVADTLSVVAMLTMPAMERQST